MSAMPPPPHSLVIDLEPARSAAQRTRGSAAPNSADRQRWGSTRAAKTVPRIDWSELRIGETSGLSGLGWGSDHDPSIK